MGKTIRVFISSTWEDLQLEREAIEQALHRMRDTAFAGMEYFGSRPETPREVSLSEVDRSDVYIGVFAHRYGSGITEAEYRRARQRNIPCLIYFKDDTVAVPPTHIDREAEKITKLDALKREIKAHHTISFFKNPDELATKVATDLHNLIAASPSESSAARKVVANGDRSVAIGGNVSGSTIVTGDQKDQPQARPADTSSKYNISIGHVEGIAIGDHAQVTQQFTNSSDTSRSSRRVPFRLNHLTDNINQDLALLKEYEDALRYEDDPRRRAKYRREIEQLRESVGRHKQEYEELRAQVTGAPSTELQDIATRLHQMDARLNTLLTNQSAMHEELKVLRQTMLARFDASEQLVIATVLERLDQNQLATVQTVLDALESGRVAESELQDTLLALQQTLAKIRERKTTSADPVLSSAIQNASEAVAAPTLDVKHKLKIAAPIIPMILSYEGEVELGSGLNLEESWKQLIAKIRGRK